MKGKTAFTLAPAVLLLIMALTASHVPSAKAQLTPVFPDLSPLPLFYVDPPTITAAKGVPFTISVYIDSSAELDLFAWQTNVTWDPSILSFTSVAWGDEPSIMADADQTNSNLTGHILQGGACFPRTAYVPITSPLKLFTVTFTGINWGTSSISLINAELWGISDDGNGWPPNTPVFNGIPEFTSYDRWPDIFPRGSPDGVINVLDAVEFVRGWKSLTYYPTCDFNADGYLDSFDFAIFQADYGKFSGGPTWGLTNTLYEFNKNVNDSSVYVVGPGDINRDQNVNLLDALLLSMAYGSVPGDPNWNANADINGDNIVNLFDAIILSNHYLQQYP